MSVQPILSVRVQDADMMDESPQAPSGRRCYCQTGLDSFNGQDRFQMCLNCAFKARLPIGRYEWQWESCPGIASRSNDPMSLSSVLVDAVGTAVAEKMPTLRLTWMHKVEPIVY